MKKFRSVSIMVALLGSAIVLLSLPARGANELSNVPQLRVDREVGAAKSLSLEVGQNRLLVLSEPIGRVSVADPKVADLKVITPTQLLMTARGVGTTDLTLWNKRDEPLVLALAVGRNLEGLRRQLKDLFPDERITVSSAGDLVVLSGEASDVRVPERAAEVAQLHADKVANLIRVAGNQQVQLEVKFAEVSRKGLREMGLNLFHKDSGGRFLGGITGSGTAAGSFLSIPGTGGNLPSVPAPNAGSAFSLFFSGLPSFPFSAMLTLLESSGLAKVLAEPTLVAMSGQEAKFLAGGEFPIPMSTGLGTVSVTWKKFGIILNFVPTVIGAGTLHLKLSTEVSDVDPSRSVTVSGFSIPGLISRQSETTVRLNDGQSFAIAGLLSNKVRSQIDKIPLLGDLPVLGALFRSVDYQRDESELLVVITARLTKPLAPHEVPPLPTDDELNDPNDFELFLMGNDGHSTRGGDQPPSSSSAGAAPHADSGGASNQTGQARADRGPTGQLGFIR